MKQTEISPCPFCGGKCEVNKHLRHWVKCNNLRCKYRAAMGMSEKDAIEKHNEIYKAVNEKTIRAKLIFWDWVKDGEGIYFTEEGVELTMGDLHSGSTFHVNISFEDKEVVEEILNAKKKYNANPVFRLEKM